MSFFSRIGRMFRSMVNSILGRAESGMTIAQMDTALRDMQVELNKFKLAVADAMAHEKRAKRRFKDEQDRFTKLTEQAKLAAQQALGGEGVTRQREGEKLAKRALQIRGEVERNLETYKKAYQDARAQAKAARERFEAAAAKLEQRARKLKEARIIHSLTESRKELQGLTEKFDIDSAAAAFDRGLESIQTESEKLEALDRLALSEGDQLDQELEKLTKRSEVQDEYEKLLVEVGGISAEASPEKAEADAEEAEAESDPALG